jgi:O-antigen/teichoic acid export membrane protein
MTSLRKEGLTTATLSYLNLFLTYVFATVVMRTLGAEAFGHFTFLTTTQNIVIVLLGGGLQIGLLRFQGDGGRFSRLASHLTVGLVLVLLASTLIYAIAIDDHSAATLLLLVLGFHTTLTAALVPLWQWHNKLTEFNWLNLYLTVIRIGCVVALVVLPLGSMGTILIAAGVTVFNFAILWRSKFFTPSLVEERAAAYGDLYALSDRHIWLSLLAVAMYSRVNILMLPPLGIEKADVGLFGYITGILSAILLLPVAVQNLVMRRLYAQTLSGPEFWRKTLPYYFIVGIGVGAFFALFITPLIDLSIGEFTQTRALVKALAPIIPLAYIGNLMGLGLMSERRDRWRARAQWCAAAAGIILNLWLIPRLGLIGAAIGTSVAYYVLYLGYLIGVIRWNCWNLASRRLMLFLVTLSLSGFTALCLL